MRSEIGRKKVKVLVDILVDGDSMKVDEKEMVKLVENFLLPVNL
jgi:hypothetical protein